jgi:undecaprenyl-diphosphatase
MLFEYAEIIGHVVHIATPPLIFWTLCATIVFLLISQRRYHSAIAFLTALFLTTLMVETLKFTTMIERPSYALVSIDSYAFPSAHAASSMFLAIMLTLTFCDRFTDVHRLSFFAAALTTIAIFIGMTRVFIFVHTPVQVMTGFLIGATIPLTVIWLNKRLPH